MTQRRPTGARGRRMPEVQHTVDLVVLGVDPSGVQLVMPVVLAWRAADPHAVILRFAGPGRRWVVARELLADGLVGPSGVGDISLLPDLVDASRRELILSSPTGRIGFTVPAAELAAFLEATFDIVPDGQEHRWLTFDPSSVASGDS